MKTKLACLALLALASHSVLADDYVNGYIRRDGTYVAPHYRSERNSNPYDNYSTRGNSNPYTGERGHADPYRVETQRIEAPRMPDLYGNPYERQQRRGW